MSLRSSLVLTLGFGCALLSTGCSKRFPPVVPTEGTVTLNGKPLPNATITFIPLQTDFGAEAYSSGTTDEQGRFTLTCQFNNQPGAPVGQHVVVVTDPPLPENLRRSQNDREIDAQRAKLGNRPIPLEYGSFAKSQLRADVKEGQQALTISLTR